ncbi:MAG: damage-inducible protein DinB [SAR324 cluster bacterium]|uniref:Damage-inducible protein DinB n=1 Tax=SAR324 cluster bacterium TaxID=2024889 RepID=A0A2A4T2T9_9DELT|nr:MAG: damage-inducible protein DinB [SAR324 cluster bacterium]
MKSNFELMASYNQWMNKSTYEAASNLAEDELEADLGAFFGSIIGTLNHILVGDRIWLKRFASHDAAFPSLDYVRALEVPSSLDTTLYLNLSALRDARVKMDEVIVEFASELADEAIGSTLSYSNTKGERFTKNFGFLLQHFFNHQTHHRGQVSILLSQSGVDVGVTDLLMSIPSE